MTIENKMDRILFSIFLKQVEFQLICTHSRRRLCLKTNLKHPFVSFIEKFTSLARKKIYLLRYINTKTSKLLMFLNKNDFKNSPESNEFEFKKNFIDTE